MRRYVILLTAVALAAVAAVLLPGAVEKAVGQNQGDAAQKTEQPATPAAMPADEKEGKVEGKEHEMKCKDMMKNIPESMKMRCRMMMKMAVIPHDPAASLALKDDLKLTEDQVKRLEAIVAQAREQAEQVLTAEQKAQLQGLEKSPKTMMEIHKQMMEKMGMTEGEMKEHMMCPLMEMMEHKSHERPAKESGAAEPAQM
jgi:hypothetical protein